MEEREVMNVFDRGFVINLASRTDRRREMERELALAGPSLAPEHVEFFPAVRPDDAGPFPSIGARGCFLSHLEILKIARERGLRNVLFMEDDLAVSPKFKTHSNAIAELLRSTEWDIVYLGHVIPVAETDTIHLIPYHEYLMTTHFYVVHSRIFDRLITFLEVMLTRPDGHPDGGPMPLDGALWTFRQQNSDVKTLIAEPNLGWQRSSRSDIAPRKWFDKVPIVSQLVAVARRGKVWFETRRKR